MKPEPFRGRSGGHRRSVVFAGILVGLLAVGSVSSLTAQAEKGSSSGGSSSSGSSSGGSGKGGGSDDVIPEVSSTVVKGDDNPSSSIPGVSSSIPNSSPTSTPGSAGSIPTSAKPNAASSVAPPSTGAPRRFERTTTCGALTMAVDVRAEKATLRVKTTIDKTSATWNAVVLQERRVTWRGTARKGRIDRVLADLPGPELLTVRLTSTTGAVCVAELQLPG